MRRSVLALGFLITASAALAAQHRFHANAVAVGSEQGTSLGSVALAPTGGHGNATVRHHDDGFVRFSEATSNVDGAMTPDGIAVTTTRILILDLDIGGRIRADRLELRIEGRHLPGAAEAEIRFAGSEIENLTIDGVAVDASLDTAWLDARPTFATMVTAALPRHSAIRCSLAGRARCGEEALGIRVDGLGTLRIGEVLIKDGWRQLNLLTLERIMPRPRGFIRTDEDQPMPPRPTTTYVFGSGDGNGAPVWPAPRP